MAEGPQGYETAPTPRPQRAPGNPLEVTLHDLWRRLLDRTDFGVDDSFDELGGHPAQTAQMLATAESIVRRPISSGAWGQRMTIRSLTKAIAAEAMQDKSLVTCARAGSGRPFFYSHGDFVTRGFYAVDLAERLPGDRPVYLLHPAYDPDAPGTTAELAKPYVDEIMRLQPTGRIDLGGYCNGGLLAWEIARQLVDRGREINRLILVDSTTINARPTYRLLSRLVGAKRTTMMPDLWAAAALASGRLDRASQSLAVLTGRTSGLVPTGRSEMARVEAEVLRTLSSYLLPRVPFHVDCIISAESTTHFEVETKPLRRLVPSLANHGVGGQHHSCITTYIEDFTEVLSGILESPPPRRRRFALRVSRPSCAEIPVSSVAALGNRYRVPETGRDPPPPRRPARPPVLRGLRL